MYGYGYSLYNRLAFLGGLDPNASAFLTATGITDPTITNAINSLCIDLKTYGVWDKMKAIYPFVGGTATTHKFNLKDSRDLDAAFRLAFNGGWTHASNGVTPNGVNGFANTFFNNQSNWTSTSNGSMGLYIATNVSSYNQCDMGSGTILSGANSSTIYSRFSDFFYGGLNCTAVQGVANTSSLGLFATSRLSSTQHTIYKIGSSVINNTVTNSIGSNPNKSIYIGAGQDTSGSASNFSTKRYAFSFIGDGLTQTEFENLYYSVQKFQTTLGRQAGTPIYSSNATDVNARLFLGATNIQDATITSAVDTLVQGLKTDGIWSKLKAVYPFVGGTATTHKFNLVNALDEDSAFRLTFFGGLTHSSTGILPNGTNGLADTNMNILSNLSLTNTHLSYYSRTNLINSVSGSEISSNIAYNALSTINLRTRNSSAGSTQYFSIGQDNGASISNTNGLGLTLGTTSSLTSRKLFQNGVLKVTQTTANAGTLQNTSVCLFGSTGGYSKNESSFASIGNNLTDAEVLSLYNRVQAFETSLSRNV